MGIKLLTLNIENDRRLDRVHAAIAEHLPDVVCLQEALAQDCARLRSAGGYEMKYTLGGRQPRLPGAERNWGLAVLSRIPVRRQIESCYGTDSLVRMLRHPNDTRRVLVMTELEH